MRHLGTVCGIGMALLVLMWLLVLGGHTHGLDRAGFDVLAVNHAGVAHALAKPMAWVSSIGLGIAALATIAWLGSRRDWADALTVLLGFTTSAIAAHLAKSIAHRARPPAEVLLGHGYSFPSSDSAVAIGAIALALIIRRTRALPGHATELLIAGIALSLAAGLGCVAVRAHYLSDVIAGWALGIVSFSASALAVQRSRTRRNPTP